MSDSISSNEGDGAFKKLVALLTVSAYQAGASGGNVGREEMASTSAAIIECYEKLCRTLEPQPQASPESIKMFDGLLSIAVGIAAGWPKGDYPPDLTLAVDELRDFYRRTAHEPLSLFSMRGALEHIRDRLRKDPEDFESAIGEIQNAYHVANKGLDERATQPPSDAQAAALHRYDRLKACTTRWHELAVSMGYDGVEPALQSLQAMKPGPQRTPSTKGSAT